MMAKSMPTVLALAALWVAFVAGFHFGKWDSAHGYKVGFSAGKYLRSMFEGKR